MSLLKTYRISYYTDGDPGELTFRCRLRDTEDFVLEFARANTLPGEHCKVAVLKGRNSDSWEWTMEKEHAART